MGETLYAVLGVAEGADAAAIERAYRDRVKTEHPDVSDDPDACEQFKRLTFARDTLVDDDERERYDRLGHARYVREHAPEDLFEVPAPGVDVGTATTAEGDAERAATDGGSTVGGAAAWWEAEPSGGHSGTTADGSDTATASRSSTGSEFYQSGTTDWTTEESATKGLIGRIWGAAVALGGWLVVHLLLLGSALGVGLVAVSMSASAEMALPGLLFLFGLSASALVASSLHLVTTLYT